MDSIESKFSSDGSYVSQQSSDLSSQQARLRAQVDQRLSCPVCLERFSDPRLLDCNHSFCRRCLVDVLQKRPKNDQEEEEELEESQKIFCPKCRKITVLGDNGIDALPLNYALNDILEILPDDTAATFSPSTPVVPFRPFPAAIPMCDEHQRHLEFFCETDDKLVCADCLVMSRHRGHTTVAAKEILERELENLRQNSFENAERMLLKVREAVDSVSNMADALKEKGEKTKARVQMHFKEIRDALETREQTLLSTTEEIVMRKVTKLEKQKEVLVKSRADLEIKVMNLKQILQNREDYSFLKNKAQLVAEVTQTVELAQSKDRMPVESTRDGPDCSLPNNLLSEAHTFGDVYCRPCPSKFTARGEGLSKGFVGKSAKFMVEAKDRYGRRSVMSGSTIKVHVQGPSHSVVSAEIEEVAKGQYQVSYTPAVIGYHLVRITADGVKIVNGDNHVVVFNKKDYFALGVPQQHISKSSLQTEPPVSTMRSACMLPCGLMVFTDAFCLRIVDPVTEELVQTIGSYGTGNGQFSLPLGLAVNKSGHIFVSDSTNHRIERFTAEGRHSLTFASQGSRPGCLNFPEGLAVSGDDKLYVADCGNDRVQVFAQKNGKFQGVIGRKGTNAGQFISPRYLAVDAKNGRLLVSDTGNFRIQALSLTDGKPLMQFGNPKGGCVYLSYPYFITVDDDGFILVTETKLHYVTVLTPRGAMVRHFGSQGDGPGQFRTPYGICVNSSRDQIIITDSTSHSIQVF